jgi:hypothetical protein
MPRAAGKLTAAKPRATPPSLAEAQKAPPKIRAPSIIRTMADPKLFGPHFSGSSWDNWRVVLKAGDGLPLTPEETEFFKSISGGREPSTGRMREQWWVVGRRGGKDSVASDPGASSRVCKTGMRTLRPTRAPIGAESGHLVAARALS